MAPTFAGELAADAKALCVVWDFPDLTTRFVTRVHSGLSLPGGWTQFAGAEMQADSGSTIDLASNSLSVGTASFVVTDELGAVTGWLKAKDASLSQARVTRREGFLGVPEAEYHITYWVLSDYQVEGRQGGGYTFQLDNTLKPMTRPLYEDFDGESYRLRPSEDEQVYDIAPNDTVITLEQSPKGIWREPGFALLYNRDEGRQELVQYTSVGGDANTQLLGCTRRKYGVGPTGYTWIGDKTEVTQVWVRRGNPIDILLQWLLTTKVAGANDATYDLGDGDGLGTWIKAERVNVTAIAAVRDAYWPQPTFSGDTLTAGVAVLFVERDPIDDLKRWVEENLLYPFGLMPIVDDQERFSIKAWWHSTTTPKAIGKEWVTDGFSASQWKRNFENRINNLALLSDWNANQAKHEVSIVRQHDPSVTRFGKSKQLELKGRGCRTGRLSCPDYGSAVHLKAAASRILLEAANPWTEIPVQAFFKHLLISLGDAVTLTIPGIPDLTTGMLGVIDGEFLVTGRRVNWQNGQVELQVRLRRVLTRPAVVAPASYSSKTYTTATTSERRYCAIAPGSSSTFGNGDDAYTVVG